MFDVVKLCFAKKGFKICFWAWPYLYNPRSIHASKDQKVLGYSLPVDLQMFPKPKAFKERAGNRS